MHVKNPNIMKAKKPLETKDFFVIPYCGKMCSSLPDSNRRPTHYECVALPAEPRKHLVACDLFTITHSGIFVNSFLEFFVAQFFDFFVVFVIPVLRYDSQLPVIIFMEIYSPYI